MPKAHPLVASAPRYYRLQKASLQADIKKSEFSVKRTKYLGFIVSIEGIEIVIASEPEGSWRAGGQQEGL